MRISGDIDEGFVVDEMEVDSGALGGDEGDCM